MKWLFRLLISIWLASAMMLLVNRVVDWEQREQRQIEGRLANMLDRQSKRLNKMVERLKLDRPFDLYDQDFSYRIFQNGQMSMWSDNHVLPGYSALRSPDSLYFLSTGEGIFLVQRRTLIHKENIHDFFSFFVLQEKYKIKNGYLSDVYNLELFPTTPQGISASDGLAITYHNKTLFYFSPSEEAGEWMMSWVIWMLLLSVPVFLVLFFKYLSNYLKSTYLLTAIVVGLLLVRLFFLWAGFPARWIGSSIFDPVHFSSSWLNPTLGDLAINYAMLLCTVLMVYQFFLRNKLDLPFYLRWLFGIGAIAACYGNIYLFYDTAWDMMMHSQIVFDISKSIAFDMNRVTAVLILLLGAATYFALNHLLIRLVTYTRIYGGFYLLIHIVFVVLFINWFPGLFPVFLIQFAWSWVMYLTDTSLQFYAVRKLTLEYMLSIAVIVSLTYGYVVYMDYKHDDLQGKKKFANRLVLENDVLGEYYLNEILVEIKHDQFVSERLTGGLFARQNIKERIRRQFLSSYFDKYDVQILLFSTDSLRFDEPSGLPLDHYVERYIREEYRTDYPEIFLVDDTEDIMHKKYICIVGIGMDGFLVVDLNLKKIIPTNVFPELLVESKYEGAFGNTFDYTIFRDSTVMHGMGKYGHKNILNGRDLQDDRLYLLGILKEGQHFYGVKTLDGRTIVISSNAYKGKDWVVNFSFFFLLCILVVTVVGLFYRLAVQYAALTLANKIQLYLTIGFLVPLFITGVVLLNTLSTSSRDEIIKDYLSTSLRVSENVVEQTQRLVDGRTDINSYANFIANVADFVQADLNIYSREGVLITTSQPGIFGLSLLSDRIHPKALAAMLSDDQIVMLDESIGKLRYKSSYTAITRFTDGALIGIVGMPFFDSQAHVERQQIEVFSDLLMVFALIFLIALVSGTAILDNLIGPLEMVVKHLKQTSLEEHNQPIDYYRKDEIGALVREYNDMLIKLEKHKLALARSQKELAWKEIARQVAHEIKNPLTPMRLKVQQLSRDIKDAKQLEILKSFIDQIDTLSAIADSFSEFAKMPVPVNTEFDLREVIERTAQLHRSERAHVDIHLPPFALWVWADPNVLGRVLNNLILNAVQAAPNRQVNIHITAGKADNKVEVRVIDDAGGIPNEIKDRVFTTYFSTKSSGSGIGLAVSKKGIEHAGGNIWFESEEGRGTTFYISLPSHEVR
jgi:two-component system, NtrC family, nitrogen regulation sensor histidine kinase NtrY